MIISLREQKITRRPQTRSLVLWKKILPPKPMGYTPAAAAWRRLQISLGHFTSSLNQVGDPLSPPWKNGILIALGVLVLGLFLLPVLWPQTRYLALELELPEDSGRTQLLLNMGHWELQEAPHLPETTQGEQKPAALLKSLETSSYTVKNGEAVSTIANKFGLKLGTLISFNNIRNVKRIQVGMKLTIPNQDGLLYTVVRGDSLGLISRRTGVTYEALLDANNLDSPVIQPGQKLFIPGANLAGAQLRQALGELFIMPARGRLTSGFGYRRDPFTGLRRFHNGIDIANASGTSIRAAMEGRVSDVGYHSSYGNYVVLSHEGGYQTMYAHLISYKVKKGQRVSQGESIAQMGNTGYSTGTHLHFSVFLRNNPVDPYRLLY